MSLGPDIASSLSTPDLPIDVVRSESELAALRERGADRVAVEHLICERLADRDTWTIDGFCQACRRAVEFMGDWQHSHAGIVNFRERLECPYCKLNSRSRFMAHVLLVESRVAPPETPTYLNEQVTRFFYWAESSLPNAVIGSEYLGPRVAGGTVVDGVRHEDALSLSFGDASLGTVVSRDVFEHVPDIDRCLAECARVLRPGGRLYFSIPFDGRLETVQRATMRDGEIVHLQPPQYHVNPIDPEGSLVFYDHGWDILDRCRRAGFTDAVALGYWSLLYGYLGQGLQLVFVAQREA